MRAWIAFSCTLLIAGGCGGGTSSIPTSPSPPIANGPAPAGPTLPAPPPGCETWPSALGGIFDRLTVVSNLCLIHEAVPRSSEYTPNNRRITIRLGDGRGGAAGEIHGIVHELCHAHQHRVILDAGVPDITVTDGGDWLQSNWSRTREGSEYLEAAGYSYLGPSAACTRSVQPGCWSQNHAFAEMGFTLASYGNPMEDNATFCSIWFNLENLAMWSRSEVTRLAPRRAAWAQRYLP